jgi:hypothetical protein
MIMALIGYAIFDAVFDAVFDSHDKKWGGVF